MPIYVIECECTHKFDVELSINQRDTPQRCPKCNSEKTKRIISHVNFVLSGDDWPGKANRVKRQMADKNIGLQIKTNEQKREQPVVTLVPNVDGEKTETWADAQKLAESKGKNASTYDSLVQRERSGDI